MLQTLIEEHHRQLHSPSPEPLESRWHPIESNSSEQPCPRSGVGEAYFNRSLIIFGGYQNGHALADLWTFDLDLKIWREIHAVGEPPQPRTSHSIVVDSDAKKMYVLCGSGSVFGSSNLGDVFEFDLMLHSWKKLDITGEKLSPRYGQSAVIYEKKIFVFGGTYGREFCSDFMRIDLETLQCQRLPMKGEVPCARYKHSAVLISPNKMLVHGGATTLNYKLNDSYIVDLDTSVWTQLSCFGDIPDGQFAHSMCVSSTTQSVWLFGGCNRAQCKDGLYKLEAIKDTPNWKWKKVLAEGTPHARYFHSSIFDEATGSLIVYAGKGSITEQRRFSDLYSLSVDNGDRKRSKICTPQCSLSSDLLNLLQSADEESSDATLASSEGEYFFCHRQILHVRCPLLFDRFSTNSITTLNVSSNSVIQFLFYLYSGDLLPQFSNDPIVLAQLLCLSWNFEIARLESLAQNLILRLLSLSAASDCVRTVERYFGSLDIVRERPFLHFAELYICLHNQNSNLYSKSFNLEYKMSLKDLCHALLTIPPNTLGLDMLRLLEESIEPFDFTIWINQKPIGVHLDILACRSSYFNSQCMQRFMIESSEKSCSFGILNEVCSCDSVLEVEGSYIGERNAPCTSCIIQEEVLRFMLRYLYGGEAALDGTIDPLLARALSRLDLSNYFGVTNSHLEKFCLEQISRNDRALPSTKEAQVPIITLPTMLWSSFSGLTKHRVSTTTT